MEKMSLCSLFLLFLKNAFGCLNAPYVTFRKLVGGKTDLRQLVFLFLLVLFYFYLTSAIRVGLGNPYVLTVKFNLLFFGAVLGYAGMILLISFMGYLFHKVNSVVDVFVLWSFTLLPTLAWFYVTFFLYLILPPPRTLSIWGKSYSLLFTAFSLVVLFWKIVLYYLTLRFALRFDLWRILLASSFILLALAGYSLLMYRVGIFRVPFI